MFNKQATPEWAPNMLDISNSDIEHGFDGATSLRLFAAIQRGSIERMSLEPGFCVLDVGCGTGAGTLALAAEVGVAGVVRGVDYDATMIAEAQRHARVDGVESYVFFHQANAAALPWPDRHFNASRSDRVLQRMLEPERAFDELVRVTRPGGRVVVVDGDWVTLNMDSEAPDIEARLPYFQKTLRSPNPQSGQCLHRLFEHYGLLDIVVDVRPVFGSGTNPEWCWKQSRTPSADVDGRYASANIVVISGRKR